MHTFSHVWWNLFFFAAICFAGHDVEQAGRQCRKSNEQNKNADMSDMSDVSEAWSGIDLK